MSIIGAKLKSQTTLGCIGYCEVQLEDELPLKHFSHQDMAISLLHAEGALGMCRA